MKIELRLLNCFLLIVPLLAWNLVLAPRLNDPRLSSDAHSPNWLLLAENLTRSLVFVFPLLLPLQAKDGWNKAGLIVYVLGTLIYFASWLPLIFYPTSAWSSSTAGLLAPRLTPFFSFLGVAMLGESWPYGLVAAAFILFHTWHGILNL